LSFFSVACLGVELVMWSYVPDTLVTQPSQLSFILYLGYWCNSWNHRQDVFQIYMNFCTYLNRANAIYYKYCLYFYYAAVQIPANNIDKQVFCIIFCCSICGGCIFTQMPELERMFSRIILMGFLVRLDDFCCLV